MEAPPVLFHSPLYRSFIIVLGKLLYEYRPKRGGVCLSRNEFMIIPKGNNHPSKPAEALAYVVLIISEYSY